MVATRPVDFREGAESLAALVKAEMGADPFSGMFVGSDAGAVHWATIASLIEAAKLNRVEPLSYLTVVLTKIVIGHSNSQLDDLLPWPRAVRSDTNAAA